MDSFCNHDTYISAKIFFKEFFHPINSDQMEKLHPFKF